MLFAKFVYNRSFEAHNKGIKAWYISGNKFWYSRSKYHRENGPALEYNTGYKCWYLKGINYTEEEYNAELIKRGLK